MTKSELELYLPFKTKQSTTEFCYFIRFLLLYLPFKTKQSTTTVYVSITSIIVVFTFQNKAIYNSHTVSLLFLANS